MPAAMETIFYRVVKISIVAILASLFGKFCNLYIQLPYLLVKQVYDSLFLLFSKPSCLSAAVFKSV